LRSDRRERGFTLIELLVVVAIVGLLASGSIGFYRYSNLRAREAVLKENLHSARMAIQRYQRDNDCYPVDLDILVEEGYLRELPYDPIAGSSTDWDTIISMVDDRDLCLDVGVEDLFSSAEGYARDGTLYSDW
jgi:general secretion pathway protein G